MKNIYKHLFAAGALAISALAAQAAPSRLVPFTVTQPNGEKLTLVAHGDEHFHYLADLDGRMMTKGADGYYRYATDDVRKKAVKHSKVAQRRFPNEGDLTTFPTTGSPKMLVILVQFPDQPFVTDNAKEEVTNMLTQQGYNYYDYNIGSVRDYFIEQSNGKFTPQIDVRGIYTTQNNLSYYGENDEWGYDLRVSEMVAEACRALDDEINFKDYDNDGDGVADNVYVMYAGYSESDDYYTYANSIWPMSWYLSRDGINLKLDGVTIDQYGCSNEVYTDDYLDGIGTFCHEFSHVLGLPDMYNTDEGYTETTPGYWDVMDAGCYNGWGWEPTPYSAYERYFCGWLTPHELTDACNVTMKAAFDGGYNDAFKVTVPGRPTEYFLFENRQQTSFDSYSPGHGMLVWHIDFNKAAWNAYEVNNDADHPRVQLVAANNVRSAYYEDQNGYPFPGTANVTAYAAGTYPSFTSWAGADLGCPITEITEKNGVITFKFKGGGEEYNGVEETLADNGVQVNALQGAVSVACNSDAQVAIYNLQGAEIASALQRGGEATYAVPAGVYVVKVGSACTKVLVK